MGNRTPEEEKNRRYRRFLSLSGDEGFAHFSPDKNWEDKCRWEEEDMRIRYKNGWERAKRQYEEEQSKPICPFCGCRLEEKRSGTFVPIQNPVVTIHITRNKMTELTQKYVRCLFNYDPITGIVTRRKRKIGTTMPKGTVVGFKIGNYLAVRVNQNSYMLHRIIWLWYYGYMPENEIDHKDRIGTHNWITNLREVSHSCNMLNRGNPVNNTSGVRGVSKIGKKWHSKITLHRNQMHLGLFRDFDEAVCHRLAAEQCLGIDGCDTDSPALKYIKEKIL